MIFVDTSAIYAVLDRSDANHVPARNGWFALLDSGRSLVTTNYVLVECCALTQSRLGLEAARCLLNDLAPVMEVVWVDDALHGIGVAALLAARQRKLSLVDCVSFAVMRQRGITEAFAFDRHFAEEGFTVAGGECLNRDGS